MPTMNASEALLLMDTYFKWAERLGYAVVISLIAFGVICYLLIWVIKKLVEGYVDQINDLRKSRDKLQNILAKKVSSNAALENLSEGQTKAGDSSPQKEG